MIKGIQKFIFAPVYKFKTQIGTEVARLVEPYKDILDFGCGDMYMTKFISGRLPNSKVTGIDVINTNLTDLKPIIYSGGKLPFKDNEFDVAYTIFVLHHISATEQLKSLNELSRVAKRLIIVEEIYNNNFEKYITFLNDYTNRFESLTMNIPLSFRQDAEWKRIFREMGLKIILEKRVYQYPVFNLTRQRLYYLKKN